MINDNTEEFMIHRRSFSFLVIILFFLLFSLGISSCGSKEEEANLAATETVIMAPVRSEGRVIAEGEVVPVKHVSLSFPASGIVEEIYIEEGDLVEKDQVIARLEGKERMEAAVTAAELGLITAEQALSDLYDIAGVNLAEAQLAVARAQKEYDDAIDDREKLYLRYGDQNQIDAAYANLIIARQAVTDAEKDYDEDGSWRREDDVIRANLLSKLAGARNDLDRAQSQYDYVVGTPDAVEIAESDSEVELAKAQLADAERALEELQDGLDPDDVDLANARVKNAQTQLDAAKVALENLELLAPFEGVIVTNSLKVGEIAIASSTQVTLADTSEWKIETTDLTELNVVGIKEQSPVQVTFDAVPELELTGKVERIKSLGVNKQGDITYTVVIKLDKQDKRLRWKMTAFVTFMGNDD